MTTWMDTFTRIDNLTAERNHARDIAVALEQELAEMRRRIAEIHTPVDVALEQACADCYAEWPCPTVLAVRDGDQ
jgi:hypothetical protein